ncbi:MAG: cytochrome P460 family protein [Myxococcaceae bacterium]|nr:cytochrome P460 family protein [Myxococcaceae bacterium]
MTRLTLAVSLLVAAGKSPDGVFTDYRSWQHVKSMVIPDKANGLYGFHHVFVEPKALAAYKAGKGYPEGSHLVVPFYEVKDEGGAVHQGPLKMLAFMRREAAAKETGGWRFGAYDAGGKVMALDVKAGCFTCHEAKKDREYVFSEWAAQ